MTPGELAYSYAAEHIFREGGDVVGWSGERVRRPGLKLYARSAAMRVVPRLRVVICDLLRSLSCCDTMLTDGKAVMMGDACPPGLKSMSARRGWRAIDPSMLSMSGVATPRREARRWRRRGTDRLRKIRAKADLTQTDKFHLQIVFWFRYASATGYSGRDGGVARVHV